MGCPSENRPEAICNSLWRENLIEARGHFVCDSQCRVIIVELFFQWDFLPMRV